MHTVVDDDFAPISMNVKTGSGTSLTSMNNSGSSNLRMGTGKTSVVGTRPSTASGTRTSGSSDAQHWTNYLKSRPPGSTSNSNIIGSLLSDREKPKKRPI